MLNEFTTEYIIPYGQNEIGEKEFSRCSDLERLYIPYYVKKIHDSNFSDRRDVFKKALQAPGFTIYGEKGTPAEVYSDEAGILFEESTMWIKEDHFKAYLGKREKCYNP